MFPALGFLLLGLFFFGGVGVAWEGGGTAERFPGCVEVDPVAGATEDFDPVGAGGGARGEEDGVAVADAGEAGGIVGVAEMFFAGCLEERVAQEERVEGVGEERVVCDRFVRVSKGGCGG